MAQKDRNKETKPIDNDNNTGNTNSQSLEESNHEKIKQLENEVEELKDKVLRKSAEFENYKRRTENDQINLLTYAAEPAFPSANGTSKSKPRHR